MTKVSVQEALSDLWADLSASQKFVTIALLALIVIAIVGSWVNTFNAWSEVRVYENAAIEASRDKDEALTAAAKLAADVKIREEELSKVEVKRDAKKQEVEKARADVDRDRAGYDAAVKHRRRDAPSTDDLCTYLAANGHPCR